MIQGKEDTEYDKHFNCRNLGTKKRGRASLTPVSISKTDLVGSPNAKRPKFEKSLQRDEEESQEESEVEEEE